PRHVCITAGAATIADLERHRGLHLMPAERLLAPRTDDLQRGQVVTRLCALPWFMRRTSPWFHRCSPAGCTSSSGHALRRRKDSWADSARHCVIFALDRGTVADSQPLKT